MMGIYSVDEQTGEPLRSEDAAFPSVEEAAKGETFIIAKGGRAMAKLVPLREGRKHPRQLGQLASEAGDVNWTRWWRDWKAADKEIEADFEESAAKPFPSVRRSKRQR